MGLWSGLLVIWALPYQMDVCEKYMKGTYFYCSHSNANVHVVYIYVYFAVGKGDLQITIVSVAHYQTFPMCVDHSCILLQIFPL